jgi:hypothetical protein
MPLHSSREMIPSVMAGGTPLRFPHGPFSDEAYWVARCEGFVVETPTGRFGVVEEVRFGSRIDVPDLIGVRVDGIRRRFRLIPVEEVIAVDAETGVVSVSSASFQATRRPDRHHFIRAPWPRLGA